MHPITIERTFSDCVMDLKEVIVLDGIDILPAAAGFRVRCHDLYGPLPEIFVETSGDALLNKDRLSNEVCKLVAIARLREQMILFLPGSRFLPLTSLDGRAIVGLKAGPKTWLAEGKDFLEAYYKLHNRVVG